MAYGYYHSVDIVANTDMGKQYSFHAEPFDEKSGGTGTIFLRSGKLKMVMDAASIKELCEKLLDCLDMDTELEWTHDEIESLDESKIKAEYDMIKGGQPNESETDAEIELNEMFDALPPLSKIKVLDGAERLGTVFQNYQTFKAALEKDGATPDRVESVEFRELDYAWGFEASEHFANFMGELGFEYEDWEPFEMGEDEEALKALEKKLNRLYGKELFRECSHEAIVNCCRSICDGRDGPFDFCGQRIQTLDMKNGEIKKTWTIKNCEA